MTIVVLVIICFVYMLISTKACQGTFMSDFFTAYHPYNFKILIYQKFMLFFFFIFGFGSNIFVYIVKILLRFHMCILMVHLLL